MKGYPFTVMCVTTEDFSGDSYGHHGIKVGDRFTAVGERIGYGVNDIPVICYEFAELGKVFVYDKRNFAILPDQSADEMQEQEREGIVNLEMAIF